VEELLAAHDLRGCYAQFVIERCKHCFDVPSYPPPHLRASRSPPAWPDRARKGDCDKMSFCAVPVAGK